MKIIASIKKSEEVRFISHLDIQRSLQRTIRRANIPVAYSQGFNPHPLISFATALSVGQTGDGEWIEIRLERDMPLSEFVSRMNMSFPKGMQIVSAYIAGEGVMSIATLMEEAEYIAHTEVEIEKETVITAINELLSGEIIVKKTKKQNGRKIKEADVDIRPMVYEFKLSKPKEAGITLYIKGRLDASGGLNADLLLSALNEKLKMELRWKVCRSCVKLKKFNAVESL